MQQETMVKRAKRLKSKLVEIRRTIHRHPELAMQETNTAAYIAEVLRHTGLKVRKNVAKTGVVGLLEGRLKGPCVALRADMDALDIQEQNDVPYRSKEKGKMHACGHDAHIAALLGAAILIEGRRFSLPGSVKFIFQPSEETPPGGAKPMIDEGVLEEPEVKAIFSLHSEPDIKVGQIGVKEGTMMAAADDFTVAIKGAPSHGARPHLGVDAVVLASQAVLALQVMLARRMDPTIPALLTIGKIHGGYRRNIIADQVFLEGTLRTLSDSSRRRAMRLLKSTVSGIAKTGGGSAKVDWHGGYPALVNDRSLNQIVRQAGGEILGRGNIVEIQDPAMGGEDFAYYCKQVPGTMFRLGIKNKSKGIEYPLHHPKFDLDEDSLWIGAAVLARAVEIKLSLASGS
ncbi:MAG: amidohydrolase [Deltaproteobacteria bacterium]|nr:amidohydrolase [Deltaproteobacteria bacterium]